MTELANRWAGRIYGTNTGNVFLTVEQEGSNISGRLRIMDDVFGVSIYEYTGTAEEEIILNCTPSGVVDGVEQGNVTVKGHLTPQGRINGEWESTIGTAGTFDLHPHDVNSETQGNGTHDQVPEQVYNKTIQIGSIRLFKDDLIQLIGFVKKDFSEGKVIVTYLQRGCELTKYASDFLKQVEEVNNLNYLKIVIQEPEAHGINRVVVVELVATGNSEIRVSGINESWVLGKSESIHQLLKPKQNSLVTTYRKYGLNLNSIIFITMLVLIPDIVGWESRTIFVIVVFLLLNFLHFMHRKFIPNTAIYLVQEKPGFLKRTWPSILSWCIAVSSSVVAAYIFWILRVNSS